MQNEKNKFKSDSTPQEVTLCCNITIFPMKNSSASYESYFYSLELVFPRDVLATVRRTIP